MSKLDTNVWQEGYSWTINVYHIATIKAGTGHAAFKRLPVTTEYGLSGRLQAETQYAPGVGRP